MDPSRGREEGGGGGRGSRVRTRGIKTKNRDTNRNMQTHTGTAGGRRRNSAGVPGPTCLAELRGAPALARHAHHGLHFGTDAGAPLLVVGAYRAHRRVRLAAIRLLQVAHVAADARALGHVDAARRAHLPVFHFRCKVTGQPSPSARVGGTGGDGGGGGGQREGMRGQRGEVKGQRERERPREEGR